MTVTVRPSTGASAPGVLVRRARRPRPGRPVLVVAGCAGVAILVLGFAASLGGPAGPHAAHAHHGGAGPAVDLAWVAGWVLMTVAMMGPLVAPEVDAVGRRPRAGWGPAAAATYLATFTAGWLALGIGARVVAVAVGGADGTWWAVAGLIVAAGLSRSMARTRVLRRCSRLGHIALSGRRSLTSAAHEARRALGPCLLLCGPVMVAMTGAHPWWLLVPTSAAVWWEQSHAMRWRDPVPPALLLAAAVAVAVVG